MKMNEPLQDIKNRRDGILQSIVGAIPFAQFLGVRVERMGDELSVILPYDQKLIGNPQLPALHGGGVAEFMEFTAIISLTWYSIWDDMESGNISLDDDFTSKLNLPKTIDLTMDYLRPGLARDAYARATVNRSGRRYASVHVEAWQDQRDRLFAQCTGHFLMPETFISQGTQ